MAINSIIPRELDWVKERAACTVGKVFNQICNGVIQDVETFNSVRQLPIDEQFRADMHPSGKAIAVAQPNQIPRARLTIGVAAQDQIAVHEEWNGNKWSVTVGLNDEGRCTLRLGKDGPELEQWQFRKKALESLLFGGLVDVHIFADSRESLVRQGYAAPELPGDR